MTKKPDQPKIPRIDISEISETFSDSLGSVMVGEGIFKIELLVKRVQMLHDNAPPVLRKYTAARIVLTNEAAVELCNTLNNLLTALEGKGVFSLKTSNDKIN